MWTEHELLYLKYLVGLLRRFQCGLSLNTCMITINLDTTKSNKLNKSTQYRNIEHWAHKICLFERAKIWNYPTDLKSVSKSLTLPLALPKAGED